jgi:nitrate reductase gamma subunit
VLHVAGSAAAAVTAVPAAGVAALFGIPVLVLRTRRAQRIRAGRRDGLRSRCTRRPLRRGDGR